MSRDHSGLAYLSYFRAAGERPRLEDRRTTSGLPDLRLLRLPPSRTVASSSPARDASSLEAGRGRTASAASRNVSFG